MCGIFFCCCCSSAKSDQHGQNMVDGLQSGLDTRPSEVIQELLKDSALDNRGPDLTKEHQLHLGSGVLQGWMRGCVLHLRGHPTGQPLVDDKGNALLWNGEIFDGIKVSTAENDTQVLFHQLTNCESDEDVLKTLESVKGPWGAIYWQADTSTLWFGRDVYGRRSLLWHLPKDPSDTFVVTSVALGHLEYTEIPSVGIFALDLSSIVGNNTDSPPSSLPPITLYPWHACRWPGTRQLVMETSQDQLHSFLTPNQTPSVMSVTVDKKQVLNYWMPNISKSLSFSTDHGNGTGTSSRVLPSEQATSVDDKQDLVKCLETMATENDYLRLLSEELLSVLQDAVMKRVDCLPPETLSSNRSKNPDFCDARIAVLFSGGLDSSIIAGLLDRCLPPDEPIDLLNVAFEQPRPAQSRVKTKQKRSKHRKNKTSVTQDMTGHSSDTVVGILPERKECAKELMGMQDEFRAGYCHREVVESHNSLCNKSSIVGGLEHLHHSSTTISGETFANASEASSLSRLESEIVDEFDPFDVPDRRTGRIALSELNSKRRWNFIEINVSQEELQTLREKRIGKLIYPLQTVLDDSIGCAVWFAARGSGCLVTNGDTHCSITSKAKVMFCGMAADEQFAGYSRHRAHFHQHGEESLVHQLEQEMWRISSRNLGRDDRIIADHGKEARFPFLDETFTEFVSKIPVHVRANLQLPRGLGEKLLLRLSALGLGLRLTACQPKRAIQFGSKIAKLDDSKEKGSDICRRLL